MLGFVILYLKFISILTDKHIGILLYQKAECSYHAVYFPSS